MFHVNNYEIGKVPYAQTVTHNRAPTDDSVKLLNEMQQAAQANIIDILDVKTTHYEAVAVLHSDPATRKIYVTFKINLNDHDIVVREELPDKDWVRWNRDTSGGQFVKRIHEILAAAVAAKLTEVVFTDTDYANIITPRGSKLNI